MTFNLTVNESTDNGGSLSIDNEPATHNVRAHYNDADAGKLFGPMTLSGARSLLLVLAGRPDVLSVTIEEIG